jgi:uncharacterized protein
LSLLTPILLSRILEGYSLSRTGTHGVAHWARVLENGRKVARLSEADLDVVELFSIFHDARRVNEAWDHGHGKRGAELARELRGTYFDLDDKRFAMLEYACQEHTSGLTQADISVQACWDADRLDLLRVGTRPRPDRLCTPAARDPEMIAWANGRACRRDVPNLIREEWGLVL